MEQKDAKKEVNYQLIKLMLFNLQENDVITEEEMRSMISDAQKKINPIIGCLD